MGPSIVLRNWGEELGANSNEPVTNCIYRRCRFGKRTTWCGGNAFAFGRTLRNGSMM
jgi:hypothetical protein